MPSLHVIISTLTDHLSWLMKTWKKRTLCGSTLLLFVCVLIMRADSTSGNTSVYTQERCQHRMRGIITLFSCSVLKEKQNNCRRGSSQPLHRNRCKRCSIHHVCEVSYCFYILPKHPNLFFCCCFVFVLYRWPGCLPVISQDGVQRREYWVLDGLRGVQKNQELNQACV